MNITRLCNRLLTIGVLIVVLAVFWSLYAYGIVGMAVASKGLRPNTVMVCLYTFGGNCELLEEAATQKGALAYSPAVFWLGILLFVGSFVVNLTLGGRDDLKKGWGAALQRLLIPVDRISTLVGHTFAWCIVVLTFAVSYEVFSRYVIGRPTTWAFDASYILYGALFVMAGPYALCRNAHVRGDFLYRAWGREPRRAWICCSISCSSFQPSLRSSSPVMGSPRNPGWCMSIPLTARPARRSIRSRR